MRNLKSDWLINIWQDLGVKFSFTLYDSESVQDGLEIIFGQLCSHILSALLFEFSKAIKHNHLKIANTSFAQIWRLLRFVHSCGSVEHCRRFVFHSKASKKCIVRESRANASKLVSDLCRASDRQSKSRKRANETEQEIVECRAIDRQC